MSKKLSERRKNNEQDTRSVEMSVRNFSGIVPTTVDKEKRSVEITIATETPVRTFVYCADSRSFIEADEILVASGLDVSRAARMPLMDTHAIYGGITKILGRVDNVRIEDSKIVGTAVFTSRNSDLLDDIAEGFYGQVSAGYTVDEYEIEWPEGSEVPVARAVKWTLHEASLVPVSADPNASVRSQNSFAAPKIRNLNQKTETKNMDLDDVISAAEDALEALDAAVKAAGDDVTDEQTARVTKMREAMSESDDKKSDDNAAAGEGARADDDADDEKEKASVRSIRSVAKTYGLEKTVDDLVALGARSAEVRDAVKAAVLERGARGVKSADDNDKIEPSKRSKSGDKQISRREIYDRLNGVK